MLKVLLRCNAHGQCGVDGRGLDQLSSHIKDIAGVDEKLREDASLRWLGSVGSLLRRDSWGRGETAQFPIRKIGSVGGTSAAQPWRGCKKKDIAEWN